MAHLPNFGRPHGREPPVSVLGCREFNTALTVNLVVAPTREPHSTPRDSHWMFTWEVSNSLTGVRMQRRLHLVQEPGYNHLTNWGARTVTFDGRDDSGKVYIPLKKMAPAQRQTFEAIANNAGVMAPNGWWNCQDWCLGVLEQARIQGVLTAQEIKTAVEYAQRVPVASA